MKPGRLKIKVSKTLQGKILKGHPWVHFYQVQNKPPSRAAAGDLGIIYDHRNRFLAIGLYDPCSDIRLRVLATRDPAPIDRDFFRERLERAGRLREPLLSQATTGFRLVHGENDGLPGLVVDRYGDTLAMKLYTAAWFPYLEEVADLLRELFAPGRLVLLLSRHVQRTSSGAPPHGKVLFGPPLEGPVLFSENGLVFQADIVSGQKTGFFFDQRDNRARIRDLARDLEVLNVFSYSGGFSVYAFAGGGRSVVEVDINPHAQEAARRNLELNFPELLVPGRFEQIQGDAFQVLSRLSARGRLFDLVLLDPPAFASSRRHRQQALQAYLRLARFGARCTRPGGRLFAASCSQPVSADAFYRSVDLGIRQTGRKGRVLFRSRHALDHPVTFREGSYLKAICLEIP